MSNELEVTDRTRVRRKADRGNHELATVKAILDEALFCHVGFTTDHGPVVIPTIHAIVGDDLYLHGAAGNHMLRTLAEGGPVCVTVTLLDGLVLAKSWFHHSMNYRSVVVFGTAEPVTDPAEKWHALEAIVEHVSTGRTTGSREPTDSELRATLVVKLPITEASAKIRTGPPIEDDDDLALPHWTGVIPVAVTLGEPIPVE